MLKIEQYNGVTCAFGMTPKSRGKMGVYVFLVDGMLIDTGPKSLLKIFKPFFKENDFSKVIITHHHEDHTGGARWIQDHKRVPIYIHPLLMDICREKGNYPLYRQVVWGKRDSFSPEPLISPIETKNGKWEAIHTPGHAKDHYSFLNREEGILFSGDIYVNPRPKLMLSFESVPTIIGSLEKLLSYDFSHLYCSHTGYHKNGREVLQRKLDYLRSMRDQIIYLYNKGLTVKEIQEKLMPKKHPLIYVSNHEWDYSYFITSVLNELVGNRS